MAQSEQVFNESTGRQEDVGQLLRAYLGPRSIAFRSIFQYANFNEMQSIVAKTLLTSTENVVIASPTGSGKTDCFSLSIVKLFMESFGQDGPCTGIKPKVVYLAPTKSLVQERTASWQSVFQPLNFDVMELSSDSLDTEGEDYEHRIAEVDIICSTPEKFDAITRRSTGKHFSSKVSQAKKNLVKSIRLLLIDEIHLLGDKRGSVLEAVIARMLFLKESSKRDPSSMIGNMRTIGLSATFPNIADVGQWLKCPPAHVFSFGPSFRPVPLTVRFHTVDEWSNSNDYLWDKNLKLKTFGVIKENSIGRPVLIFLGTRAGVSQQAKQIFDVCDNFFLRAGSHDDQQERREQLDMIAKDIESEDLKKYVRKGVAFHHAGLSIVDRRLVENGYVEGFIQCLCSTSTLAMGINLPAHMVVIVNTKVYRGGYESYDRGTILQMLGRAGRPGFDTSGLAVIMTSHGEYEKFRDIEDGAGVVESCMLTALEENINSEIVMETINDIGSAVDWLDGTFLSTRAKQRPAVYDIKPFGSGATTNVSAAQYYRGELRVKTMNTLKSLDSKKMLSFLTDGMSVIPTHLGLVAAKKYVKIDTAAMFGQLAVQHPSATIRDILVRLGSCAQFFELSIRMGEKGILNAFNKNSEVVFKLAHKVGSLSDKLLLLYDSAFSGLDDLDSAKKVGTRLREDKIKLMNESKRIVDAMIEHYKHRSVKSPLLANVMILKKMVKHNLWNDYKHTRNAPSAKRSFRLLQQLEKVGAKTALKLHNANLSTFESIAEANVETIAKVIKCKPERAIKLSKEAASVPRVVSLTVEQIENEASLSDTTASLQIVCQADNVGSGAGLHPFHLFVLCPASEKGNIYDMRIHDVEKKIFTVHVPKNKVVDDPHTQGLATLRIAIIHKTFLGHDEEKRITIKFKGHRRLVGKTEGKKTCKRKSKDSGGNKQHDNKRSANSSQATTLSAKTETATAKKRLALASQEEPSKDVHSVLVDLPPNIFDEYFQDDINQKPEHNHPPHAHHVQYPISNIKRLRQTPTDGHPVNIQGFTKEIERLREMLRQKDVVIQQLTTRQSAMMREHVQHQSNNVGWTTTRQRQEDHQLHRGTHERQQGYGIPMSSSLDARYEQQEYHYADQYTTPLANGHYGANANPYIPGEGADTREGDHVSHRAFRTDTISPNTYGQQVRQISFDDAFGAF